MNELLMMFLFLGITCIFLYIESLKSKHKKEVDHAKLFGRYDPPEQIEYNYRENDRDPSTDYLTGTLTSYYNPYRKTHVTITVTSSYHLDSSQIKNRNTELEGVKVFLETNDCHESLIREMIFEHPRTKQSLKLQGEGLIEYDDDKVKTRGEPTPDEIDDSLKEIGTALIKN